MKKRIFTTVLSLVLAMSLVACGGKKDKDVATNDVSDEEITQVEEKKEDFVKVDDNINDDVIEEEVIEDTPEMPQTAEEIAKYMKEEAELYCEPVLSEHPLDNTAVLIGRNNVLGNEYDCVVPVKEINGDLYLIATISEEIGDDYFTYTTQCIEPFGHSVGYASGSNSIEMDAKAQDYIDDITNSINVDLDVCPTAYVRVEQTNDINRLKITIKLEDDYGIDFLRTITESVPNVEQTLRCVGVCIDYDRFVDNTASFYINTSDWAYEGFAEYLANNPDASLTTEQYLCYARWGLMSYRSSQLRTLSYAPVVESASIELLMSQQPDIEFIQ